MNDLGLLYFGEVDIAILNHSRDDPQIDADGLRMVLTIQAAARIVQLIQDGYNTIVLLLCGGDKSSQKRDIERAKTYWQEYKEAQ